LTTLTNGLKRANLMEPHSAHALLVSVSVVEREAPVESVGWGCVVNDAPKAGALPGCATPRHV